MPYVITKPEIALGVYDTWSECKAALEGTKGERRYMKVSSREEAENILDGRGVSLALGSYAFTDGNSLGGIGVVLVGMEMEEGDPLVVAEFATTVGEALRDAAIPHLDSDEAVRDALKRQANVLAEVAAVFVALRELSVGARVTIVHDFVTVRDWMEGSIGVPKNLSIKALVLACNELRATKRLELEFMHQPGHRSTWAGRHDLARFNQRADELATKGSSASDVSLDDRIAARERPNRSP